MAYNPDHEEAREAYVLALAEKILLTSVAAHIAKSGHYSYDLLGQEAVRCARAMVNTMGWSLPVDVTCGAPWLPTITPEKP